MKRKLIERVVAYLFMAGAAAFLIVATARQWDDFVSTLGRIDLGEVVLASLMGVLAIGPGMLSWRQAIAATSRLVPVGPSTHAFLVSQLGKYVPGSVWAVVAQVALMRRYGISRASGALGSTISMVVALGTAVVVGTVGVFAAGGSIATYWWLIPVAVACTVVLLPAVLQWAMRMLGRTHSRFASFGEISVSGAALLKAAAWNCVGWVFWGLQLWFLMRGLGYRGVSLIWFAIGAYALAWAVGRVIVLAPGGIGPREVALVAILGTAVSPGDALALTVITRVLMSLLDVVGAGLAAGLRRWLVAPEHAAVGADS